MKILLNLGVTILIMLFILIAIFLGITKYKDMQSQIETQIENKLSKENQMLIENLLLKEQVKQKESEINRLLKEVSETKELLKQKDMDLNQKNEKRNQDLVALIESIKNDKNVNQQVSNLMNKVQSLEKENSDLSMRLQDQISKKNFYKDSGSKKEEIYLSCQKQLNEKDFQINSLKSELLKPKECVQKPVVNNREMVLPKINIKKEEKVNSGIFVEKKTLVKKDLKNTYPKVDELN